MARKTKQILIIFFFLLVSTNTFFAQNANNRLPLVQILNILQERYSINFNYAEDSVEGVFLEIPRPEITLQEALVYLEANTNLSFRMMSDNIILIQPKDALVFCGYLIDKDTNEPLISATVQTNNHVEVTDEKGFFQLKLSSDTQIITIRYIGYKTITKPFSKLISTNCLPIEMQQDFLSLSEVVISNYITTGINKINNGSYEIDFESFDILPGLIDNDVLQSVQAFPGIQSVNETVSNINIRGGTHDQNLILWDGIKMYQSGHFFGLISMYHPQITQTVSLIKNGSDVSYTDGVSGTIVMNTEKEKNDTFHGVAGINLTDVNGFIDVPINNKSSLQVAARKSISDFFETPTYSAFFDRISQNTEVENNTSTITNSDKTFDFYDTSFRWIYNLSENDEIRVNFINVFNELQFNENAIIDSEEESRESNLTQNSIAGALLYNRTWNSNFQTSLEVYETDYKLKAINVNILDAQRFLQENKVSETSIKLKANSKLNNRILHKQAKY